MKTISEKKLREWLEFGIRSSGSDFDETGDRYWQGRKASYQVMRNYLDTGVFYEDDHL